MLQLEQLANLVTAHSAALGARVKGFSLGGTFFGFNEEPALMGVINLSPESWYRESVCLTADAAIERGRVLMAQGAHFLDLGAESTLPHAALSQEQDQIARLVPVVKALSQAGGHVSVETYLPQVARRCLEAGAHILNLTGMQHLPHMLDLAKEHGAAVILCHVEGENVRRVEDYHLSQDPVGRLHEAFGRLVDVAVKHGVEKLILDPGLGFYYRNLQDGSLRVQHQMNVFLGAFRLRTLGFPLCNALPHAFDFFGEEVRSAEAFFAVLAALGKTDVLRTHEIPKVRAVLRTMEQF